MENNEKYLNIKNSTSNLFDESGAHPQIQAGWRTLFKSAPRHEWTYNRAKHPEVCHVFSCYFCKLLYPFYLLFPLVALHKVKQLG